MEKGKKLRIAFPPPEKLTITRFSKELFAFTLAEVLITLGIIGVVAAITIPSVVAKFQHKALESQFKKTLSVTQQVFLKAKTDFGLDNFAQYCTYYPYAGNSGKPYDNAPECYEILHKTLLNIDGVKSIYNNTDTHIVRLNETIRTYNNKADITTSSLSGLGNALYYTNVLPDGSYIGFSIIEASLNIVIDTNGAQKPNRLGHDIFFFKLDKQKDMVTSYSEPKNYTDEEIEAGNYDDRAGNPCNLNSSQKANGIGCSYYALMNKCPYDDNKTYFECLP